MAGDYSKLHHLYRLVTVLQSDDSGNAAALAERFGLHERTIFRYLETLSQLGVPWYFDGELSTYRIRKDFFLPPLHLTASETLALTWLVEHVAGSEQIAMTGPAARAIEKIRGRIPQHVLADINHVDNHIAVRLPPAGPASEGIAGVFEDIQQAIQTRRAVRCRYESLNPESKSEEPFVFRPYALSFDQRSWYAIGEHTGHGEVRRLKLNRFIALEPTDSPYAIPDDFSLEAYRGKAWRMIRGDTTYRVAIHFDAKMSETVSDTQWHSTQHIGYNDDGSIIFHCEVEGLDEIVW